MVAFEVSDLRLDRTASFATLLLSPRQPPRAAASDVDRGVSLVNRDRGSPCPQTRR